MTAKGLSKRHGETIALLEWNLEMEPGEVLGLLGRNGAGKSTTVRLVVGLDRPTSGEVRVFGERPEVAARANRIGYCGQEIAVYPSRSVAENLIFFSCLAGLGRAEADSVAGRVAERLGLDGQMKRRANELSGGFKRRLHLALALVGDAPLLVLDEPTAGVDIESRELILGLVRQLADQGHTVMYASHDLAEVERLCDRVMILSRGVTRALGTVHDLSSTLGQLVRLEFEDRSHRERARQSLPWAPRLWGAAGLDVQLDSGQSAAEAIRMIETRGLRLRRAEVVAPGLESVFLQITRAEDEAQESGGS